MNCRLAGCPFVDKEVEPQEDTRLARVGGAGGLCKLERPEFETQILNCLSWTSVLSCIPGISWILENVDFMTSYVWEPLG